MPKIETTIEIKGNVAYFTGGRNNGLMVGLWQTAKVYLGGHTSRANMVDAQALAAGYQHACDLVEELEKQLKKTKADKTELIKALKAAVSTYGCASMTPHEKEATKKDRTLAEATLAKYVK